MKLGGLIAALLLLFTSMSGSAQKAMRPPCAAPPLPSYASPGEPLRIETAEVTRWTAPRCAGWVSTRSTLLVGVAGSFQQGGGVEALLATFGRVSTLAGTRYWSVSDHRWRTLVTDAAVLEGPGPDQRRPDFTQAEMAEGRGLYFV